MRTVLTNPLKHFLTLYLTSSMLQANKGCQIFFIEASTVKKIIIFVSIRVLRTDILYMLCAEYDM